MVKALYPIITYLDSRSFLSLFAWLAQMKEKYTKMRPYGEWLAEQTVILQQVIDSVPPEQRRAPPVLPAGALPAHGNGALHVSSCFTPRNFFPPQSTDHCLKCKDQ